jgi:phosphomannomutase
MMGKLVERKSNYGFDDCFFTRTMEKKQEKINGKQFVGSTIVSTPMMMELATNYEVECKIGLTGFKWIAK